MMKEQKLEKIKQICESIINYDPKHDNNFKNRPSDDEIKLSKIILKIINHK